MNEPNLDLAALALARLLLAALALALAPALAPLARAAWAWLDRPLVRPAPPLAWWAWRAEFLYLTRRPRRWLKAAKAAAKVRAAARALNRLPYFDSGLTRREYERLALAAVPPSRQRRALRATLSAERPADRYRARRAATSATARALRLINPKNERKV